MAAEDGADDALRGEEIRRAIDTALEDLTPAQREAFVLKHVEGYSYVEIAEMLGDGVDALKMRVHRAREVVKERLKHLR